MKKLELILLVALGIIILSISAAATYLVAEGGWAIPKILIVQSGSMEPVLKTGGIVLVYPKRHYQIGDIITFKSQDKPDSLVTHRIAWMRYDNATNTTEYMTSGDANASFDQEWVKPEMITGRVVISAPLIGYGAGMAKKPQGFILLVIVPATIIVYEELRSIWKHLKLTVKKRKENEESERRGVHKAWVIVPSLTAVLALSAFSGAYFAKAQLNLGNTLGAATEFASTSPIPSPTPIAGLANHLIISEVQINGSNANQDFVELYNPKVQPVDIQNWKLRTRNSNGTESSLVLIGSGAIPAHGYFLWATSGNPSGNYASIVGADVSNTNTIANNSSIALLNVADEIIDQVAWGNANSQFVEGSAYPDNPGSGRSIERKAYVDSTAAMLAVGGIHTDKGNGYDTNDNSSDFVLRTVSQPQNSTSATETP